MDVTTAGCDPPVDLHLPDSGGDSLSQRVLFDFAEERADSSLPWLFHKTTRRTLYNQAHVRAQAAGLFDVIFCNERDEITEGCITNIFILKDGVYSTPPLECGLLDGIMRKQLLAVKEKTPVFERVLFKTDILEADKIFLSNSVRGVVPAQIQSDG
jgi:para-aminobenzoate synthetase/4-amino-4-deoxychorismate lyase